MVSGGAVPNFPARVELYVRLLPVVPFGGAAGTTRQAPKGGNVLLKANPATGRMSFEVQDPLFAHLDRHERVVDTEFGVKGNVIRVVASCDSRADMEQLVQDGIATYPAVLTVGLPDAPIVEECWGTIDGTPFQLHYLSTDVTVSVQVATKTGQEDRLVEAWASALALRTSRRMAVGLQYFHSACRLLLVGQNRFEFTAEAILNFAKCLQAFFGDSRDEVRAGLRSLGYNSQDLDGRFLPAMVLRDQFDVAHVSLSALDRDQLAILHRYADIAEKSFRELCGRALAAFQDGTFQPPEGAYGAVGTDKRRVLGRLVEHLDKVG